MTAVGVWWVQCGSVVRLFRYGLECFELEDLKKLNLYLFHKN